MSARIFIHPRCVAGPPGAALIACLQGRGYDCTRTVIAPASSAGNHELVRLISETDVDYLLERMDGLRYIHYKPGYAPPLDGPRAA